MAKKNEQNFNFENSSHITIGNVSINSSAGKGSEKDEKKEENEIPDSLAYTPIELKSLIAEGKNRLVLEELKKNFTNKNKIDSLNEVIILLARLSSIEQKQNAATESSSTLNLGINQLNTAILAVIDKL